MRTSVPPPSAGGLESRRRVRAFRGRVHTVRAGPERPRALPAGRDWDPGRSIGGRARRTRLSPCQGQVLREWSPSFFAPSPGPFGVSPALARALPGEPGAPSRLNCRVACRLRTVVGTLILREPKAPLARRRPAPFHPEHRSAEGQDVSQDPRGRPDGRPRSSSGQSRRVRCPTRGERSGGRGCCPLPRPTGDADDHWRSR